VTDAELIAKKLAQIETYLRELRTLADLGRFRDDVKEERFVTHTLQLAVQAAIDVGSHVVSDDRLGEPATNAELFTLLERNGWLAAPLARRLGDMARFRNLLVHGYADVDLDLVEEIVRSHLDDLEEFIAAVRAKLA